MKVLLWLTATCLLLAVAGCSGRAQASDQELVGTYVTDTDTGREELVLHPDKTYIQTFSSTKRHFVNRGAWEASRLFFEGTEVQLRQANVSEDESSDRYGGLMLQVHREHGKVKLARNEAADWYYQRVQ